MPCRFSFNDYKTFFSMNNNFSFLKEIKMKENQIMKLIAIHFVEANSHFYNEK